jgi:DNA-binding NtrC family response regulator
VKYFLFIGYDPDLHSEIHEYLAGKQSKAYFTSSAIETIRLLDRIDINYAVLNLRRLEDAGILRYININFRNVIVLIMPGETIKEAIPALTQGSYKILSHPFSLDELKPFI